MSADGMVKSTSTLLAGRWQVPLALVAAVVAGVTLYHMVPEPPSPELDTLLADVAVLEQSGDLRGAADAVGNLLETEMEKPLTAEQRGVLHARLAELIYRAERDKYEHNEENARLVLEHYAAARELGWEMTPKATLREAYAQFWLGDDEAGLARLRTALDRELSTPDRRRALRTLVEVLERRPQAQLERRQVLEELLEDETTTAAYLWWALHHSIRDALDDHDVLRARELLAKYGPRLQTSDLRGYLDFLRACVMLNEGRPEEAAPLVRWVDDWLGEGAYTPTELDDFGHLPSLNRWLMGRIHLAEDRPQDALLAFDETLEFHPKPRLRIAINVGRGLALAALDRHADALEVFEQALDPSVFRPRLRGEAAEEFRGALVKLFSEQWDQGRRDVALDYLTLATQLVPDSQRELQRELYERLGDACRVAAQHVEDPVAVQRYHARAGEAFENAAERAALDEDGLARLLWAAADQYDAAGRIKAVRRTLRQFIRGRSDHPNMPRALLQLGRACEAFGELDRARTWYARLIDEFPEIEEAARAKLLSAGCLLLEGPERYLAAEETLAALLTSGVVEPDSAIYREALLSLCELLNHQGRYAETISRLSDFLELYPGHPERFRARFMLANANRRSAYALAETPPEEAGGQAALEESRRRFRAAADMFASLLKELEQRERREPGLDLYERLSLFYRADCLFELNEPETLRAALATYRNAAARYDGHPAALTAQIQMANIYLRQGDVTEAARAIERARWLLRSIPREAYGPDSGASREEWDEFLTVIASSTLFDDVLGATP